MRNDLKLVGKFCLKVFRISLFAECLVIVGLVMIAIAIVRVFLLLIGEGFGCAFAKGVFLDPWNWFFLIAGLTTIGYVLLRCAINHPEGYAKSTSFFYWFLSPREIGDEVFIGELLWVLFGLILLVLMWSFDRLC